MPTLALLALFVTVEETCKHTMRMEKRMKVFDLSVLLLAFISLPLDAFTQTKPSINIGIDLQLGMARDAVVAKLAANYKVEKLREVAMIGSWQTSQLQRFGSARWDFTMGNLRMRAGFGPREAKTVMNSLKPYAAP